MIMTLREDGTVDRRLKVTWDCDSDPSYAAPCGYLVSVWTTESSVGDASDEDTPRIAVSTSETEYTVSNSN